MQSKWPWFERRFDFDFPASKMPDIFERLDGTVLRLSKAVAELPENALRAREGESWSIQENVGHLGDLEPLWLGRIFDIMSKQATMRAADLSNRQTFAAAHNETDLQSLLERFQLSRNELLRTLDDLTSAQWALSALHPRLNQPMRIVDLCLFVAEHDDYHLARIRYLRRHFSEGTGRH